MSNAATNAGAFAKRKFSINRNTGVPRESRRYSVGEPTATGESLSNCLPICEAREVRAVLAVSLSQRQQQLLVPLWCQAVSFPRYYRTELDTRR